MSEKRAFWIAWGQNGGLCSVLRRKDERKKDPLNHVGSKWWPLFRVKKERWAKKGIFWITWDQNGGKGGRLMAACTGFWQGSRWQWLFVFLGRRKRSRSIEVLHNFIGVSPRRSSVQSQSKAIRRWSQSKVHRCKSTKNSQRFRICHFQCPRLLFFQMNSKCFFPINFDQTIQCRCCFVVEKTSGVEFTGVVQWAEWARRWARTLRSWRSTTPYWSVWWPGPPTPLRSRSLVAPLEPGSAPEPHTPSPCPSYPSRPAPPATRHCIRCSRHTWWPALRSASPPPLS